LGPGSPLTVQGAMIEADVLAGACLVFSVRGPAAAAAAAGVDTYLLENALALAGCEVQLFSPDDLGGLPREGPRAALLANVTTHRARLATLDDPFAPLPTATLATMLAHHAGGRSLSLLALDAGGDAWPVLNQLYVQGSGALRAARQLLLTLPRPPAGAEHMGYALYQHLFQESGLCGLRRAPAAGGSATVLALARPEGGCWAAAAA